MPGLLLTVEIAALAERTEPDPGPEPGTGERSHEDFVAFADRLLAEYVPDTLQVFAYGSLIWNPEFEVRSAVAATAVGWHRSFCFSLTRWRGTRELPGLMMALDRGGSCRGLLLELANGNVRDQLISLMDRELDAKRPTNVPKWIWV